jgi:hypothetical protein
METSGSEFEDIEPTLSIQTHLTWRGLLRRAGCAADVTALPRAISDAPSLERLKGMSLGKTDGGTMRIVTNIVGVLLVLIGSIWFLQGINVLPGSFMTGQTRWAVRGGILVFAGIAGLVWANRKRKSAA